MLHGMIGCTCLYNSALGKFDFRGQWSVSPKNRGQLKKTQGWIGLKSGGGSLAAGTYLQRGSAPPPPGLQDGLSSLPSRPTGYVHHSGRAWFNFAAKWMVCYTLATVAAAVT